MNTLANLPPTLKPWRSPSRTLSIEEQEAFGNQIEQIRDTIMQSLGEKDAKYIYNVRNFVRLSEIGARALLMIRGKSLPLWMIGTGVLGLSKIVENMELGHNVMHGQFDWMNDPTLNGAHYDWDTIASGDDWKHTHNYIHHTFTNIIEKDHDIGYGIIRVATEQKWEPRFLFNLPLTFILSSAFEWWVGVQNIHLEEALVYKTKSWQDVWQDSKKFRQKALRQLVKDYVVFPLLAGPNASAVAKGNFVANLIRNYWASAVIYCGHFTEQAEVFEFEENETRAQWYLRQIKGSSNFGKSKWLHFLSGNLSHQIEHHLFPDMPANRYSEAAPQVEALCKKYGQHYNKGSFAKQLFTVGRRLAWSSLPPMVELRLREKVQQLKHKMSRSKDVATLNAAPTL